jgi:hypothetical protein
MSTEDIIMLAINKGYIYDEITGIISYKGRIINAKRNGYISMSISVDNNKQKGVYGHQFGYYYKYKKIGIIDHKDRDRINNKIENLHIVSHNENNKNKVGKGYSIVGRKTKKFQARIIDNKKYIKLGLFETEQEAHQAYLDAKKIYHKI